MATFSQQFLANLGRPAMTESLFGLGRTIGGLPGQAQERKKREQFNQLMQQGQAAMASGDAAKLAQIGQQLTSAGFAKQGQALTQASVAAKEKQRTQAATGALSRGEQALTKYASAAGMQLKDPRAREYFFRLGTTYNVPFETSNKIYESFIGEDKKEGKIVKGNEVNLRDTQGNYYTSVVMYDEQTGTPQRELIAQPGSPAKPVGRLSVVSGTTGAGAFDQPEIRGQTKLETDYSQLRVDAVAQLPNLQLTAENLQSAIDLLESGEVQTGGFPRRIARGLSDFMGTTPQNIGEFEVRLGQEVLARLEAFTGAISEGERQFLVDQIGNYFASGESNIGRLKVLLDRANRLIQNSILIGSSPNFESYRTAVMTPMKQIADSDLDFIPENERDEARQALQNGQVTLEQLQDMY
jgi:hypothetical protein